MTVKEYTTFLALAYFKEKQSSYLISEMMELLGLTQAQVDNLISQLLQNGFISYDDSLLKITSKGLTYLITNNCGMIEVENKTIPLCHISPERATPIDEPYVPKRFLKKYKK